MWQDERARCGVVLGEVFLWLQARELARAGAVCRAWRRAAAEPPLWRRLLRRDLAPGASAAPPGAVSWQREYATARAGWALRARHVAAAGAALLHADLAHGTLALGAADASVALWRRRAGAWAPHWRTDLRRRGWAAVARVQWAGAAPRLLLAGPRALVHDWELVVLQLDGDWCGGTVACRVRCSAGAAGCWADVAGDAFLSLELRLLGPGLACTTVRLNAATQETQSEYAGVTTPLLTIYNEDRAHITHALVVDADERRTLVAGTARGLGAWPVAQPRPPPLLVGAPAELAERVRRHRARTSAPPDDAPVPDEAAVRAACAAPERTVRLDAALVGLVLGGGALWAACSDGSARCVCPRSLRVLREVRAVGDVPRAPKHYVQLAVSDDYVASPEGSYSPRVWTWSQRSSAASPCGGGPGADARHGGAAVCALLPGAALGGGLLVLAGDSLYEWCLRVTSTASQYTTAP